MTVKTESKQDTAAILNRIQAHLNKYMQFENPAYPLILSLWTIHTHTFSESFPMSPWTTPYLYVYSETPGAGKSKLIEILEPLVLNPEKAEDLTSAAMFRLIESVHPTLFVDEVDTVFNGAKHDDLRRTLNTGYKHGGFTYRVSGGDVEKFATFAPKLLAGIRNPVGNVELPETVRTRSIPIKLVKTAPPEMYYSFIAGPEAEDIAAEISAWVRANGEAIVGYMPKPGGTLVERPFELAFPLLQIARVLGVESETRAALSQLLAPEAPQEKPEITMLRKIRDHFDVVGRDKVHSAELAEMLGGWTPKHLSQMLRPFGINGSNTMSIDGKVAKGYWRSQFEDVWGKYL